MRGWSKNHRHRHYYRKLGWRWRRLGSLTHFAVVMLILWQQYSLMVLTIRHGLGSETDDRTMAVSKGWAIDGGELSSKFKEPLSVTLPSIADNASSSTTASPPVLEVNVAAQQYQFLIFRHVFTGQGAGNVVTGLLATHLLAQEFNRTVCVDYPSFQMAFAYNDPNQAQLCHFIQERNPPTDHNTITRNNYDLSGFSSECSLRERLVNKTSDRVLYFTGNTYPQWPSHRYAATAVDDDDDDDDDYLHRYYHPTSSLLQILPWPEKEQPPRTVVHLRQADGDLDIRPGLDDATLQQLGEALPSLPQHDPVFLVTNRVEWYDFFEEHHGWLHPPWMQVQHSGLHISWGGRNHSAALVLAPTSSSTGTTRNQKVEQDLQLWADWYTLLRAATIYHTPSDFSKSAARWNPRIVSWTIRGTTPLSDTTAASSSKSGSSVRLQPFSHLDLERDFEDDGDDHGVQVLPLVRRTLDQMKFCDLQGRIPNEYKESRLASVLAMAKRRREADTRHFPNIANPE